MRYANASYWNAIARLPNTSYQINLFKLQIKFGMRNNRLQLAYCSIWIDMLDAMSPSIAYAYVCDCFDELYDSAIARCKSLPLAAIYYSNA